MVSNSTWGGGNQSFHCNFPEPPPKWPRAPAPLAQPCSCCSVVGRVPGQAELSRAPQTFYPCCTGLAQPLLCLAVPLHCSCLTVNIITSRRHPVPSHGTPSSGVVDVRPCFVPYHTHHNLSCVPSIFLSHKDARSMKVKPMFPCLYHTHHPVRCLLHGGRPVSAY